MSEVASRGWTNAAQTERERGNELVRWSVYRCLATIHGELDVMLDGAEDAKVVKAAKHTVTNAADPAALAPLILPPEVGTRPSDLLPRLQVGVETEDCHSRPCCTAFTLSPRAARVDEQDAGRPILHLERMRVAALKAGMVAQPLEPSTRLVRPLVCLMDIFLPSSDGTLAQALLDLSSICAGDGGVHGAPAVGAVRRRRAATGDSASTPDASNAGGARRRR